MLLTFISQDRIDTSSLPEEVSGMHWVTTRDAHGTKRYAFVEAKDEAWILSPRKGMQLTDGQGTAFASATLDEAKEAVFPVGNAEGSGVLIARPVTQGDKTYSLVGFSGDEVLTIGSAPDNVFVYPSRFISAHHVRIDYVRDAFSITDLGSANATFVNGMRIEAQKSLPLAPGDIVEILGLIITIGFRFISHNNPAGALTINATPTFVFYEKPDYEPSEKETDEAEDETEFFYPAPRFMRDLKSCALTVDPPPHPEKEDETPVAMKIGPSMVMALAAVFSGVMMFTRMQESGGSFLMAAPMLVMAVSMVAGSVLWPLLSKRYTRKKTQRAEAERRERYAAYLDEVRIHIKRETALQKEILEENRVTVAECMRRALEHDVCLMDRTPAHTDFLDLRLGTGTLDLASDIRYPDEHFSVEKDDLREVVYQLAREPKDIKDAPVAISFVRENVIGIAGEDHITRAFTFGLLAQIACLHSYEDVKVVLLCDEDECAEWAWAATLPHLFTDDRAVRFFAASVEEASEISLTLMRIAEERREATAKQTVSVTPHYIVVCTAKRLIAKSDLVTSLAKCPAPGFTLFCRAPQKKDLPKQCSAIIEVAEGAGTLQAKDDTTGKGQAFAPDIFTDEGTALRFARALNMVTLDIASAKEVLPDSLGFLEMYEAGNLEQLNVRSRWKEAKATETLAARVGTDPQGEPFFLNLHERFHGPHGLIAGTTGSGKSEFIITWILSMCVEYSPEEVAFVLIDYKGGGLAGAFDNEKVRLPHLAGTITNLDGAAIARSLVSIKSELKRRQALFNQAREVIGGDNVDIYKYLELYRTGNVVEACPHLFIVADEFAELKAQEPEFMDELISAARIGRSLGVHLVLATQKPSGVVNDQIWSNSKFKVCLKVADKQDSLEMIKRAEAAEITQTGRFYLLIGYNEYFALGQSAYTGFPYVAQEQYVPAKDDAVALVSHTGRVLASAKPLANSPSAKPAPQIVAVLRHLADVADSEGLRAETLWLNPIPTHITIDELINKYPRLISNPFALDPIVGELDDPASQAQYLLTLPLSHEGNAIMYGSAGSGVEAVLSTTLFSLLLDHDASMLNAYIADFGSESLGMFREAPQVGDVIFAADEEKMSRLFDMLDQEVRMRRKLFASYAGSYIRYCEQVGDKPAMLLVINGIAVFTELYDRYESRLMALARDGIRVGLYILITATTSAEVRMRLRSNFKLTLACGLADKNEYLNIFGTMRGVVAPSAYARGLTRSGEELYEFQGARVLGPDQDEFVFVQKMCGELASLDQRSALSIPVLPETVTAADLLSCNGLSCYVPFGIFEDDLSPAVFDFEDRTIERCVFSKAKDGVAFVRSVLSFMARRGDYKPLLIDGAGLFSTLPCICDQEVRDDEKAMALFDRLIDGKAIPPRKTRLVFVSGIAGLLMRVDPLKANTVKLYLRHLHTGDGAVFVLFDAASEAMYSQEDWFRAQLGAKEGLWIGEGLDSQTSIQVTYGIGERVDPDVKGARGYAVSGGKMRKVKLLVDTGASEEKERVEAHGGS